jgi:hypothetical protein
LAYDPPPRRDRGHPRQSAITHFAPLGSPPTSRMAAPSSTPRKWRRIQDEVERIRL